jgi:hypothetical protein
VLIKLSDAVVVNVTDCLSGMHAGQRFRSRTNRGKAGWYRDNLVALAESVLCTMVL